MTSFSELYVGALRVLTTYARAVDDHDEASLAALLGTNVSIYRGSELLQGREAFLQVFRNSWASGFIVSKHFVHNVQVDSDSEDRIRCRAYFQAITTKPGGSNMMLGKYDDILVLEGHTWKIETKRNILQAVIPLPPSSDEYAGMRVDPTA